ncbi:bifunctional ADP-dependent NAD(P)H-hydrate dehydratase/NAD(P)H-hydrate epimerase [Mangrovimonas sp. DI 80]|uniref:bifunctional ADP-dependent NAD(P)H-hydrate dehydratase/NAD(P)H-hydrate epimerase n=1 Tax=Mangrovimonas sp. DI 80 TaxID=1779330 RepID=UPI00097856BC|nr:bifunctional ADP-dependent NAD(P)H-hydrate dehydratase/NAD(P)H-hydrate epimerase [Mangrovimonas sp. DI 80]OMP30956.1 carbohydrate kinase [Mangrovimonas sp. DI 80]
MKILSKEQVYEGDRLTAERQNISSTELMERAATKIFNWIHTRLQGQPIPIHVFCGIGNNGGDGLVLSRHLINYGYNVNTYIVNYSDKRSKDFLINYDRIKQASKNWPVLLNEEDEFPNITPDAIIVDAVFGIGLNRPAHDWVKKLFQHFRASKAFTLSVDIPSGLFTDRVPEDENGVVWANYTLSFQTPKLVFFLPETGKFTTEWEILDIGIDPSYLQQVKTEAELIGKFEMLSVYKPRDKFSHKGDFGHAMIIGGSYGKIGAVTLASKAALTAGAGLITAYVPKCGYVPLQSSFPEAMVMTDNEDELLTDISFELKPSAVGIGVGMGTDKKTVSAFEGFLKRYSGPLVVDADGINMLAANKKLLELLQPQTILTPHPKELKRLIGEWKDDFDKLEKIKTFTSKYNLIIVVKGANTMTVFRDRIYVNSTGNPGLATAGTGDVLTGVITGMLSQGYEPLMAVLFGVYLHGKAADIAVMDLGYQALNASVVIEALGEAYLDLFKQPGMEEQEKNSE